MTELERLGAALDAVAAAGGVPVLATLVSVRGSAYRASGARMVVRPDGSTEGAVSGGCLEKDLAAHAEQVRGTLAPTEVRYDLTGEEDAPWGLGMGCSAELRVVVEPCPAGAPGWMREALGRHERREPMVVAVDAGGSRAAPDDEGSRRAAALGAPIEREGVLYDVLLPPLAVVACGDGPDAATLATLAAALGWVARTVRRDDALPPVDERTAVVLMTHNYERDLGLLRALGGSPAPYVGLLGPRARAARLLSEAGEAAKPLAGRLRAPVGLDIGAVTPEEIALAVLAEVRAAFAGRRGGPLADRQGPIHDR